MSPVGADGGTFLYKVIWRSFLICLSVTPLFAQLVLQKDSVSVLAIRVSFQNDDAASTTGNGDFLMEAEIDQCGDYLIDSPPHNKAYFQAHLQAVDSYYRGVSGGEFGIDVGNSVILPPEASSSYQLDAKISDFNPYGDESGQEQGLVRLFQSALEVAYSEDAPDFDDFDIIAIFHAGIGQDFSLPFIDPTQEDIPSAYIDSDDLAEQLGTGSITFPNRSSVSSGIVLPETQNHLLYSISTEIFSGVSQPCDYQFALTGTFALMLGFAVGLPPLWNLETGESGVGVFALMDQGSNNGRGVVPSPPDPWTRIWAGWETANIVTPTQHVNVAARDSAKDQILRVNVSDDEYFLIENRNNWLKEGVDIDSLRWMIRSPDIGEASFVQVLFDSGGVERDEATDVVTSVPNYDLGLPGSGLLIWHIDESRIAGGIATQSVNADRQHRGIDLEEADGAQDIGFPSAFLFADPSTGLWSDMWFEGNDQFTISNPAFLNRRPSFGPETFPSSKSNSGADSHLELNDFSPAGRIMSFTVENSLLADGFPDTSLHLEYLYDFNGDGVNEIFGMADSLWWSTTNEINPSTITPRPGGDYRFVITNVTAAPELVVAASMDGKISLELFSYSAPATSFESKWNASLEGDLPSRIIGYPDDSKVGLHYGDQIVVVTADSSWEETVDPGLTASWMTLSPLLDAGTVLHLPGEGMAVRVADGTTYTGFEEVAFQSLAVADLDGDARMEIIATDSEGTLHALNRNLTLLSGFPAEIDAVGPVLAGQLIGDDHPEVVTKTSGGDILILDWTGKVSFKLSSDSRAGLKMISVYQGRNAVLTSSEVWMFDEASSEGVNAWPAEHGDVMNRRLFQGSLPWSPPAGEDGILDGKRTYCYPNPVVDGTTTLRMTVGTAESVTVNIYDLAGFFVERIEVEPVLQNEVNEVTWDASKIESGVYLANVEASFSGKSASKILKIAVIN